MYKIVKRLIDVIISTIGIIVLTPIFIIIVVGIKLDSKGEIIFKHKRLGKDCKPIYIFKFRTMVKNAMELGPERTDKNDNRITKIGKFLRKTSLDELPQLFNVFLGNMSLIGPRPDAYTEIPSDYQKNRTKILPGLTGLSQVNGRSSITLEDRVKYDLYYVKNYSFLLDIKILLKTLKIVINKEGVN